MTVAYGKGRVFCTALGHAGEQLKSVAFIATFQRGAEWAATGKGDPKRARRLPHRRSAKRARRSQQDRAANPWVVYDGYDGPGKGKHIVLISGDEEYRSEEALPQLGKILAKRHGFKCTVLFAVDPATGMIDPNNQTNIPGLEAAQYGRLDDHLHAIPQFARRSDAAHRPLRRGRQADYRHPHRHARVSTSPPAEPTRSTVGTAKSGTADSGAISSAKRGSAITAIMARKARAA